MICSCEFDFILFFCRPVKFVVGILNSLVITKRHFLQTAVVHAAFVLVFCEQKESRSISGDMLLRI